MIQQVLTPGTFNSGEKQDYAFGLGVSDHKGLQMVSHGGAFAGFRAEMIRFPEQAFSVICLANVGTFNPTHLAKRVADICLADHVAAEETEDGAVETRIIKLAEESLADKVGVYMSETNGMILELFLRDGKLTAEIFGQGLTFAAVAETEFVAVGAPFDVRIEFERQDGCWSMRSFVQSGKPDDWRVIEVVSPGAKELAEYVGDYFSAELQASYKFVLEDGKLYVRRRGAQQDVLKPGARDVFRLDYIVLVFDRDDAGRVTGVAANAGRVRNIRFARRE